MYVSPTHNNFRSDTFTVPTPEIIAAASTCSLGDENYEEEPDTAKLAQTVADIAGKEAGLFCVSGVMSNQIAIRSLLHQPPYSILLDHRAHVYRWEAGGLAMLSNALIEPVIPKNGIYMTLEDIKKQVILDEDIYFATTRVVCLENTCNGVLYPYDEFKRICDWCHEVGLKVHLDGARIWNASIKSGVPISEYCKLVDTVSLCLSKGIGAPIGSIVCSDKKTMKIIKKFRKQTGGAIRQSGVISSMAMVALKSVYPEKMKYSHEIAAEVGQACERLGIKLEYPVDTNFVFLDVPEEKMAELIEVAKLNDLEINSPRIAFHYQISRKSVDSLIKCLETVFGK